MAARGEQGISSPGLSPVAVTGPVTLREAPRWHEVLRAAMAEGQGPVRVDLTDSGPWDVAGLQLLLSSLASGRLSGRPVRLVGPPPVLRGLAKRAGVLGLIDEATDAPTPD